MGNVISWSPVLTMKRHCRVCFFGAAMIVMLLLPQLAGAGEWDVSPPDLLFGQVVVGQTAGPRKVTFRPYFGGPIRKISVSVEFSQTNDCPAQLSMFGSCSILVTFKPLSAGWHTGVLRIEGAGFPTLVHLSGTGVPTPTPTATPTPTPEDWMNWFRSTVQSLRLH